jgi:hypothetical protein
MNRMIRRLAANLDDLNEAADVTCRALNRRDQAIGLQMI